MSGCRLRDGVGCLGCLISVVAASVVWASFLVVITFVWGRLRVGPVSLRVVIRRVLVLAGSKVRWGLLFFSAALRSGGSLAVSLQSLHRAKLGSDLSIVDRVELAVPQTANLHGFAPLIP